MHFTPDCRAGAPNGGTIKNSERRYVIDEQIGSCNIILKFGGNMPDSHEFRLVDGKLVTVHTITGEFWIQNSESVDTDIVVIV
jgi:hypothetical protein